MTKPIAIDLCCGLGGWTEGLLAEGWRVRGYDIEAHEYGDDRYPAELVIRNVLEMHGSEIADADLIVARRLHQGELVAWARRDTRPERSEGGPG